MVAQTFKIRAYSYFFVHRHYWNVLIHILFLDDRISFLNNRLQKWHSHFPDVIIGYVYVIIHFFFTDCSQIRNE